MYQNECIPLEMTKIHLCLTEIPLLKTALRENVLSVLKIRRTVHKYRMTTFKGRCAHYILYQRRSANDEILSKVIKKLGLEIKLVPDETEEGSIAIKEDMRKLSQKYINTGCRCYTKPNKK